MRPKLPIIVIFIEDLSIYYYNLVTCFVLFVSNCTQLHLVYFKKLDKVTGDSMAALKCYSLAKIIFFVPCLLFNITITLTLIKLKLSLNVIV